MSIKADHLNAILDAIKAPGGGPGSLAVGESWWGIVVVAPGEAEEYTDARYWVQPMHSTNTEGNDQTQVEIDVITETEDDPIYGVVTASNLAEVAASTHSLPVGSPVFVTTFADEQAPPVTRYAFRAGVAHALFAVKVWQDGGTTDGDNTTPCDRTYTVRTLGATAPYEGGILLGEEMVPMEVRPPLGQLVTPPGLGPGVIGRGYYDEEGEFQLLDANETILVVACG